MHLNFLYFQLLKLFLQCQPLFAGGDKCTQETHRLIVLLYHSAMQRSQEPQDTASTCYTSDDIARAQQ